MRILVLWGNSVSNKSRCADICVAIKEQKIANNCYYIMYNHWDNQTLKVIDFWVEEKKLLNWIEESNEPYKIICKSVGSILFLSNITKMTIKPLFVLICGLPLRFSEKLSIRLDPFLQDHQFPLTLMQNESDPEGSFEEVQEKVAKNTKWKLIKLAWDSHHYEISDVVNNFTN